MEIRNYNHLGASWDALKLLKKFSCMLMADFLYEVSIYK